MRSLATPSRTGEIVARLNALTPDTPRRWGTMSPHEMLCHLADSFRVVMGQRTVTIVPATALKRRMMRLLALHLPLRWPQGIPTVPEVDPKRHGTPPAVFDADRHAVLELLHQFASEHAQYTDHPIFGRMPRSDWLIWGYRHTDHHLRQFGL